MATYQFKGKITCVSRTDGSTVASWFKDLTIDAFSPAEAKSLMESNLKKEYEDDGIRIVIDMAMLGDAQPVVDPAATAQNILRNTDPVGQPSAASRIGSGFNFGVAYPDSAPPEPMPPKPKDAPQSFSPPQSETPPAPDAYRFKI